MRWERGRRPEGIALIVRRQPPQAFERWKIVMLVVPEEELPTAAISFLGGGPDQSPQRNLAAGQ